MLSDRLGLPDSVQAQFAHFTERWDGKGDSSRAKGEEIPLSVRIAHVARDAAFQRMLGGDDLRRATSSASEPAAPSIR